MNHSTVTILNSVMTPDKFTGISLIDALDLIKSGAYKARTMQARQLLDDEARYKIAKKQLPAIAFNGTFKDRVKNENFQQSSGLWHFDVDGLAAETIEQVKANIAAIPSCVFCFVSPSGEGLKGALRIEPEIVKDDIDYKRVYAQGEAYFKKLGISIDPSRKDVSGKCFVSYDPDIYTNYNAEVFSISKAIPEQQQPTAKPKAASHDTESVCIDRVIDCIKSSLPRHSARLRAGRLAGGYIEGGLIDEQKIVDILMQISDSIADGSHTTNSERKTILDGVEDGRKSPIYSVYQKQQQAKIEARSQHENDEVESEPTFRRVSLADVLTNPPEQQRYIWGGRVPVEELTLLAAHGGTGKSLFGLQLAAHTSTGSQFLGLPTEHVKTLFFSAEDATNTIRRRVAGICKADGLEPVEVDRNLIVLDATDAPCLFHEISDHGVRRGEVTAYYSKLKKMIEDEGVGFLIVDNASDTFGANPIDRQAVTKFIRALVRLVRGAGGAVLLLSHVNKVTSKNGKNQTDTEGYADSAAWHNAARSRLFLLAIDEYGNLSLAHQKNNLGKKQQELRLAFREDGSSLYSTTPEQSEQAAAAKQAIKAAFRKTHQPTLLKLIHEYFTRGEWISPSVTSANTNAFAMLKKEASFPFGISRDDKAECLALVRECERDGLLFKETYKKPDRHDGQRWALTAEGLLFIGDMDKAA